MFGKEYDSLILNLKKIPGITKKQSEKIAFYILNLDYKELDILINSMQELNKNLNKCSTCNFITRNVKCEICLDANRSKRLLLVESDLDVIKLENSKIFDGKYFVFNFEDKESIENDLILLFSIFDDFNEIIISFSPTIQGIAYTNYISSILLKKNKNKKISKIAYGIPIGSKIDYMDSFSIKESIENRKEIKNK
ncbi:toprim domain-containing protein [Mesomycoplasma neurolyticum]|uniref:Recombination protein RecR n=1 Tax=Mesomycoplasma neurolyticum TaxID=2120 RepID=A0A449A574_9BACT|nr:toprim domain-containing protein [Mesomycoplasma neurolyticum]VEU59379.1 recombination protein recR [Mesomycoplasma neurolyticum]